MTTALALQWKVRLVPLVLYTQNASEKIGIINKTDYTMNINLITTLFVYAISLHRLTEGSKVGETWYYVPAAQKVAVMSPCFPVSCTRTHRLTSRPIHVTATHMTWIAVYSFEPNENYCELTGKFISVPVMWRGDEVNRQCWKQN